MSWLIEKLGPRLGKVVFWVIVALLIAAVLGTAKCALTRNAKVETNLAKGQADASLKSGSDAVETVGNQQAAEMKTDAVTKENDDAIRKADGADVPVAAGVRDAGLASLCRRAAYRRDPKCLQHASPE